MSSSGIQRVDVINAFQPLSLDDLAVSGGQIDPESIAATYNIDGAWIGQEILAMEAAAKSVAVGSVTFDDTSLTDFTLGSLPGGEPAQVGRNRYYHNIMVHVATVTTSPRTLAIHYVFGAGADQLTQLDLVTGRHTLGPIFVPAGAILRLVAGTGGAGDTTAVNMFGLQALPGVPLPIIPAFDHNTSGS